MGVVAPVVRRISDDSADSGTPRGRLQRGPRWFVPPSRARLAAHVHSVENRPLATHRVKGRRSDPSEGIPLGRNEYQEDRLLLGVRREGYGIEGGLGALPKTPLCRKRGPCKDARGDHR